MTMPELVPERGPVRSTAAELAAEGLGPEEVLTGSRTQRAVVRGELAKRLTKICPPAPGNQDPDSRAQDDLFGAQHTLSQEPAAVGLPFLIAHMGVCDRFGGSEHRAS